MNKYKYISILWMYKCLNPIPKERLGMSRWKNSVIFKLLWGLFYIQLVTDGPMRWNRFCNSIHSYFHALIFFKRFWIEFHFLLSYITFQKQNLVKKEVFKNKLCTYVLRIRAFYISKGIQRTSSGAMSTLTHQLELFL